MLAVTGELPDPPAGWAYEVKWDGNRCLATITGGSVRLAARTGNDATARFPELHGLGAALGDRSAVLDGEVVVLDASGAPSFQLLQRRAGPVQYLVFDVLWLDGRSTTDLPYTERRAL